MKYILSGLLGLIIGVGGSWLVFAKTMSALAQLNTEILLLSTAKYIELLDTKDASNLRDLLAAGLPCLLKSYEEGLQSYFWDKSAHTESVIARVRPYSLSSCEGY